MKTLTFPGGNRDARARIFGLAQPRRGGDSGAASRRLNPCPRVCSTRAAPTAGEKRQHRPFSPCFQQLQGEGRHGSPARPAPEPRATSRNNLQL